jgi:hypothetical protein
LQFKTIKSAQVHTRGVIKTAWQKRASNGAATVSVQDPDFEFFQSFIQNHPNKHSKFVGAGVCGFEVRENRMAQGAFGMYANVVGPGLVDFSWLVCCGFKPRALSGLLSAMRMAVRPSMLKFRKHALPACVLCPAGSPATLLHVDHAAPSFRELSAAFITATTPPTEFDSHADLHMKVFRREDQVYTWNWQRNHDEHATLRMLCPTCNLTRQRK